MVRKIIWSPHAAESLHSICSFIELDSVRYATIFAQRVVDTIEFISKFPETGRIVPEYNIPYLREKILGNYRIIYRLKEDVMEIVVIVHGSRLLKL